MRMRRKKHLDERFAACGDRVRFYWPDELAFSIREDGSERIDLTQCFDAPAPVEMEIGCGKGGFICELAQRHPEVNFLAVEKNESALLLAVEKAAALGLRNVYFLSTDAEYLARILPTEPFARRLYLNFSCPFPKKRYASHRLTDPHFLAHYRRWLLPEGEIRQKTDDANLFTYSLESLSKSNFTLEKVTLDLHNSDVEGNIVTEYEARFLSQGKPIYYLEARPKI